LYVRPKPNPKLAGTQMSGATNQFGPALLEAEIRSTAPFQNVQEAWFWTMASLMARRQNCAHRKPPARACLPEDVLRCLDTLYRRRRIDLTQVRIMRIWGERGVPPNPARAQERCDWRLWREALGRLDWPLRVRGLVATSEIGK
jgi:hypothetical protein